MRALFEEQIALLERTQVMADQFAQAGAPLSGAARIAKALDELREVRAEIFAHWPLRREQLERSYPLDVPPLRKLPLTGPCLDLLIRWPRYQDAVPVTLAAGALAAVLCDWLAIVPLWVGFLVGYLPAAALAALAYSVDW
jgi:hypothetical protein